MQALDRPEPPAFPLNAALLPACRQRVKLAVRLDAILREQSKAHAGVRLRTPPFLLSLPFLSPILKLSHRDA